MAGEGRPPTTLPCGTKERRGWPAFAGHDTGRRHVVVDALICPHALIGAIEAYLRQRRVVRLRISALAVNEAARRSYQHAGFAPYEILHEKRIGPGDEG